MKCAANLNAGVDIPATYCQSEAAYTAWTVNCSGCLEHDGREECRGHPVCVEHGAALRTTGLKDKKHGERVAADAVLARICTLT